MEPQRSSRETGEIELLDYLRIVWRWRWLVLAGPVAGILAAFLLTMLTTPTHRVAATVDAGDFKDPRDRDLERLVARLNDQPAPARVIVQYRRPYTIDVSAESRRPADALAAVERVTAVALEELNRLHEIQRMEDGIRESGLQSRLDALRREQSFREERQEALRRGLEELERARAAWARPPGDALAALLFAQLSQQIVMQRLTLAQLEDQIRVQGPREVESLERQLKLAQLTVRGRAPRIVAAPQVAPVGRRLRLALALGMVVGLVGSVLLAVVCEYARGVGRRATVRESA